MPQEHRITSPEQLNNYIRITSPGVWIVLSAIAVLLAGLFVWLFTGQLEVSSVAKIYTSGSESLAFVSAEQAAQLQPGMRVRISESGSAGTITEIAQEAWPFAKIAEAVGKNNTSALGIYDDGRKFFRTAIHFTGAPQGVSQAVFILGTVKPASFLLK